jgi:hypothetical protein
LLDGGKRRRPVGGVGEKGQARRSVRAGETNRFVDFTLVLSGDGRDIGAFTGHGNADGPPRVSSGAHDYGVFPRKPHVCVSLFFSSLLRVPHAANGFRDLAPTCQGFRFGSIIEVPSRWCFVNPIFRR